MLGLGSFKCVAMGSSRRSVGLLCNSLALQAGSGGRSVPCSRRLLASVSDSEFSGLEMTGDRNVDIFDRALKSKQVPLVLLTCVLNRSSFCFGIVYSVEDFFSFRFRDSRFCELETYMVLVN